ncbi:MAG: Rpp14/Pop5 family protein [Candidatus Caldarchaeum sp.]
MGVRVYRMRKRYVAVTCNNKVSGEALENAVKECFTRLYGVDGLLQSGLRRVSVGRPHVFLCGHLWVPRLVLALTLVRQIGDTPVVLKTTKVSGTVRSLWSTK